MKRIGTEGIGITNDSEIHIDLLIGIAFVMNSCGTLAMRIAFASSFVRRALTMRSFDARKLATKLRTIQDIPKFRNNRPAHKDRYVSIETQP
ncbi:MAG TPA: hypothetical protein VJ875_05310 [Pyrinomonadaceae bacterium]|nr:hypothetical protein [Pyrinomonadaceae bacterium]